MQGGSRASKLFEIVPELNGGWALVRERNMSQEGLGREAAAFGAGVGEVVKMGGYVP